MEVLDHPELAFGTLEECLRDPQVKSGGVRVRHTSAKTPGIYLPPPDDSAYSMELDQVKLHFKRRKAAH